MGKSGRLLMVTALVVSACAESGTTESQPVTTIGISSSAVSHIDEALGVMREQSIYTDSVDWEMIESATFERASDAQTPADTYEAIEVALRLLGDDPSVFLSPLELLTFDHGVADFDTPEWN